MTGSGSRVRRTVRLALGAVVLVASLACFGAPADAQSTSNGEPRPLRLISQTSWVGENGTFQVIVSTEGLPADAVLDGLMFPRVATRAALEASTRPADPDDRIFPVSPRPLAELVVPGTSTATVSVRVSPTELPGEIARIPNAGVYPFVVRALRGNEVIASVTTYLIRLAPTGSAGASVTPLLVGVTLPLAARASLDDGGRPRLDDGQAARLERTIEVVGSAGGVPVTLLPSAESLALLGSSERPTAAETVEELRSSDRPALAGPYAPIDTGAWTEAGLVDLMDQQYTAGAEALGSFLGRVPDGRTAVLDRTVTSDALEEIKRRGTNQVVVPSDQVGPSSTPATDATFARRFTLDAGPDVDPQAVLADVPTAVRLRPGGDPVQAAHLALAELAVLQLGQQGTGTTNGVAVVVPDDVAPEALAPFLAALGDTGGVAGSGSPGQPLVSPVRVDQLFSLVSDATAAPRGSTTTQMRGYLFDEPANLGDYPDDLRDADRSLGGLRSLVPGSAETVAPVASLILVSGDRTLDEAGRSAVLGAADTSIAAVTDEIVVDDEQVVTLTSSSGEVPLNLENRLSAPVTVRIEMRSAKLEFPEGSVIQQVLDPNASTPVSLQVETRASGAFPLDVTIRSADGALAVATTEYTVRSTAISGIGLALSIGAGLFLLVWWARHFRTARRARKLVAAGTELDPPG